ncbi:MAG: hypothetical protein ACLRP8_10175 [Roseburia intestinalis]
MHPAARRLFSAVPRQGNTMFSGTIAEEKYAEIMSEPDAETGWSKEVLMSRHHLRAGSLYRNCPDGIYSKVGERGRILRRTRHEKAFDLQGQLLRRAPILRFWMRRQVA